MWCSNKQSITICTLHSYTQIWSSSVPSPGSCAADQNKVCYKVHATMKSQWKGEKGRKCVTRIDRYWDLMRSSFVAEQNSVTMSLLTMRPSRWLGFVAQTTGRVAWKDTETQTTELQTTPAVYCSRAPCGRPRVLTQKQTQPRSPWWEAAERPVSYTPEGRQMQR